MLILHETAYLLRFYISDEILMSSDMFCLSCLQQNCTDGVERVTPRLINKVTHVVPSKSIFVIRSDTEIIVVLNRAQTPCFFEKCSLSILN